MTTDVERPDGVAVETAGRLIAWIPGVLRNPMNGAHGHWSRKAADRKGWRERTKLCVTDAANRAKITLASTAADGGCFHRGKCWHDLEQKVVVLTAYVWNLFDDDGLAAALKPVLDGLVDAHVLHADDSKALRLHRVDKRQQINRKHRGVEVVVEPR